MKTILLPTDFSDVSDNAIQYAVEMAKLTQSKLILLHVYHVPIITSDTPMVIPSMDELGEECMQNLQKTKSELLLNHSADLQIECVCRCGLEVDEIEEYTQQHKVDLIIT
ncbi:MAG: hypothetical protein JWO32_672, partial [Bacteroidetes bacterium]|nr:hypothetical protein [Bacteroidota bacterium]